MPNATRPFTRYRIEKLTDDDEVVLAVEVLARELIPGVRLEVQDEIGSTAFDEIEACHARYGKLRSRWRRVA